VVWCPAVAQSAPYDELARSYDSIYTDRVCRSEDEAVAAWLASMIGPGASVLDIGCGTGWLLDHLDREVDQSGYVGVDLSAGMLKQAKAKHPWHKFIRWDMGDDWPLLHEGGVDVVVSTFASPSYATPEHFAQQAVKALRPGGRAYLMPHGPGELDRAPYLPDEGYAGSKPWGEARTREAMETAGFTDISIRGFRHPRRGPSGRWPMWVHRRYLRLEEPFGRAMPNAFTFLLIEGVAQ